MSFICYYCSYEKDDSMKSKEHIVHKAIGGILDITGTREVCKCCNKYMADHVDRAFCRNFFIAGQRMSQKITKNGVEKLLLLGFMKWERDENVQVFQASEGETIFRIVLPDGSSYAACSAPSSIPKERIQALKKMMKAEFSGTKVEMVADVSLSPDCAEVLNAIKDHFEKEKKFNLVLGIDKFECDRGIVKIALGLACKILGAKFVSSKDADVLRKFVFEDNHEKRIKLSGAHFLGVELPEQFTNILSDGNNHVFAFVDIGIGLAFYANFFGFYANTLLVATDQNLYQEVRKNEGLILICDPINKVVNGPMPMPEFLLKKHPQNI